MFWDGTLLPAGSAAPLILCQAAKPSTKCRIPQFIGWEGPSGDHPVQRPTKPGSPKAGDTGMCPAGFGSAPGPCYPPWKTLPQTEAELVVF